MEVIVETALDAAEGGVGVGGLKNQDLVKSCRGVRSGQGPLKTRCLCEVWIFSETKHCFQLPF